MSFSHLTREVDAITATGRIASIVFTHEPDQPATTRTIANLRSQPRPGHSGHTVSSGYGDTAWLALSDLEERIRGRG